MLWLNRSGRSLTVVVGMILVLIFVGLLVINQWIKNEIQKSEKNRMKEVATISNSGKIDKNLANNNPSHNMTSTTLNTNTSKDASSSGPKSLVSEKEVIYEAPLKDVILIQ